MTKKIILLMVAILFLSGVNLIFAEQKSITLPKGTTLEKLGQGHFKFKLPNGGIVEVKGFDPKTGVFSYYRIDDDPTWKSGKGQLKGQIRQKPVRLPAGTKYVVIDDDPTWIRTTVRVPKAEYIMIDDDIVWLPAIIQFQEETIGPKGLSPQPDPPGRLR